jgi:branched-chain amino acid transport system permease protein
VNFSWERLGVILVVLGLSAVTYWFFRSTRTGLAIRASATDREVASLLGVSARKLSVISWLSGSMVAGVAGIALASLVVTSDPNLLLLLTVKAFVAAIVGGMVSFPVAVGAAFGIGLGEEWARHYLLARDAGLWQGAPEVLTLGAVIVVLALRPKWIFKGIRDDEDAGIVGRPGAEESWLARAIDPAEAYRSVRAAIGHSDALVRTGRVIRRAAVVALLVLVVGFPYMPFIDRFYVVPANLSFVLALVVLSFVVLVGWLGQVSLAQGAFVAVGGAGAAVTAHVLHLPFPLPILGGVLLSIPVSLLVGLPALRLRGLHLAVATLAFGVAAERAIVPRLFGNAILRPPSAFESEVSRYYLFLGLTWLANSVVAGIGSIAGPVIGAFFFNLWPELSKSKVAATSLSFWPQIVSSALLIVIMAVNPGGLASMSRFVRRRVSAYAETEVDDLEALSRAAGAAGDDTRELEDGHGRGWGPRLVREAGVGAPAGIKDKVR